MDFSSWASWGKKAGQSLMEAVGAVDSATTDSSYAAHRQNVKAVNRGLEDLNYHIAKFSRAVEESDQAFRAICTAFGTLNAVGEASQGVGPAADNFPELDAAAAAYHAAAMELEKSLKKSCGTIIEGCEMTLRTVDAALEEAHAGVDRQRQQYDGLRQEVQAILESGRGNAMQPELEAKSAVMDRLALQYEQGKAGLETQYRVVETTAASNVQSTSIVFFREVDGFLTAVQKAIAPLPARLASLGDEKAARLRAIQDECASKQEAIDAKEKELSGHHEPAPAPPAKAAASPPAAPAAPPPPAPAPAVDPEKPEPTPAAEAKGEEVDVAAVPPAEA